MRHNDRTTRTIALTTLGMMAVVGVGLLLAAPAFAIAAFARKEGQACTFCHDGMFPNLNEDGRTYLSNGFRFPDVESAGNIWDDNSHIPISILAEVEGFIDHGARSVPGGGKATTGPDGKIDEVEIMAAGTLTNQVSFFAELEFKGGTPVTGPVWVQINDLAGPQGALNFRVGQYAATLPFLAEGRRVVRNHYLANTALGLMDTEFGAGLNGQVLGDADNGEHTHRYAAGVMRGNNLTGSNAFVQGYGWYAVTWDEVNNIGAFISGGQNNNGVVEFDELTLGAAGQTRCGPLTFTGSYTYQWETYPAGAGINNQSIHNVMGEVLYSPNDSWVVGLRSDWLINNKQMSDRNYGTRNSALLRYNVLANVWVGGEYRLDFGGGNNNPVSAETAHAGRLFAFLMF